MKTSIYRRRTRASWLLLTALVSASAMVATPVLRAATPLLELNFNETGSTAANNGTAGGSATLTQYGGTAADLHTASGAGVSGLAGDRAFDNSASNMMGGTSGAPGQGGGAVVTGGAALFNNLKSFTVTGWYNSASATAPGNYARLLDCGNVSVLLNPGGIINFGVTGASGTVYGTSAASSQYSTAGSWVFFAVTYDGSLTSNNANFYVGNSTTTLTQVGTAVTINAGAVKTGTTDLAIGNISGTLNRPFDGYLDDFSVYGSTSGSGGVLTVGELEAIRLTAVPEPNAFAFVIAGVGLMLVGSRARRLMRVS